MGISTTVELVQISPTDDFGRVKGYRTRNLQVVDLGYKPRKLCTVPRNFQRD